MAYGKAECICTVCGETFYKEKKLRNRTEANSWERWASEHYDLCPNCYSKKMRENEINKGLYVDIKLNTSSIFCDDDIISFVFGGDTMPHKDQIKLLGGIWTDNYPEDNIFNDLLQMNFLPKKWVITCTLDELPNTLKRVEKLGAKINSQPSETDIAMYMRLKSEHDRKKEEIYNKINVELGEKPKWPDDIREIWPNDTSWNGKFYGKPNCWNVYFSGEKVYLTDDQKERMEEIYRKRIAWKERKKQLEQKYNRR